MATLKVDTNAAAAAAAGRRTSGQVGKRPSILSSGKPPSDRDRAKSKNSIHRSGSRDSIDSIDMKNSVYKVAATLLKRQKQRESEGLEITYERPALRYEPSYKTSPDIEKKFSRKIVREVTTEVILKYMENEGEYNPKNGKRLALGLAEIIKDRMKDLDFSRYKMVVEVVFGELSNQGIEVASQSMGDTLTDNYCVVEVKDGKKKWFCTALVFGIYYD